MARLIKSFAIVFALTASWNIFASDVNTTEAREEGAGISILDHNDRPSCHYIRDPHRCNRTHNCSWNRWANRCTNDGGNGGGGGGGGGGGHGDWRCNNIQSPRHCERTRGCEWSWRRDRCVSRSHH